MKAIDRERVYEAADRFVQAALRTDDSLFTPGTAVWTRQTLDELHKRFIESPDTSSDAFEVKLQRQLSGATRPTLQLMAEVLYVHFLVASSTVGGQRKRDLVNLVLSWSSGTVAVPPELDAALNEGVAAVGTAFNTYRPFQLYLIIDSICAFKQKSEEEQQALLDDPWAFKEFLFSIPIHAAYSQREALLHLVFPDVFENIVSRDNKRRITDAFREELPGREQDVDRALLAIRKSLEERHGGHIDFYGPGFVEKWQSPGERPPTPGPEPIPPRGAWLVRGTDARGQTLVDRWLAEGYVSIGWHRAGHIPPGATRKEIRAKLEETSPDGPLGSATGQLHRFISEMKVGDLVVAPAGARILVGVVTSDVYWAPSDDEDEPLCRRRSVDWFNPQQPLARESLSQGAYSALRTLLTVSNVSAFADEFASLVDLEKVIGQPARPELVVPLASESLSEELLLPSAWLQNTLDLLGQKRQLIFYGPPGTGKTFVAQRLAAHITSGGGTYKLVQFHPSYAYEDFVEGYRPRQASDGGGIAFELVPGPLRQTADAARKDPGHPYVLIIDEINRGNLAKVFGELYFLLEYREEVISLQYSSDQEFSLPANLFVIGTMNTADRSIALVDAAMRRRFYFVPFFPQEEPTAALLRRWLEREGKDLSPALLLEELNEAIADRDFAIGPSYFMTPRIEEDAELERIWQHAIMPLLEEQFFGSDTDVPGRFGLPAIRRRVAAKHQPAGEVEGAGEKGSVGVLSSVDEDRSSP